MHLQRKPHKQGNFMNFNMHVSIS
jgi:hypothetical protein